MLFSSNNSFQNVLRMRHSYLLLSDFEAIYAIHWYATHNCVVHLKVHTLIPHTISTTSQQGGAIRQHGHTAQGRGDWSFGRNPYKQQQQQQNKLRMPRLLMPPCSLPVQDIIALYPRVHPNANHELGARRKAQVSRWTYSTLCDQLLTGSLLLCM